MARETYLRYRPIKSVFYIHGILYPAATVFVSKFRNFPQSLSYRTKSRCRGELRSGDFDARVETILGDLYSKIFPKSKDNVTRICSILSEISILDRFRKLQE